MAPTAVDITVPQFEPIKNMAWRSCCVIAAEIYKNRPPKLLKKRNIVHLAFFLSAPLYRNRNRKGFHWNNTNELETSCHTKYHVLHAIIFRIINKSCSHRIRLIRVKDGYKAPTSLSAHPSMQCEARWETACIKHMTV